MCQLDTIYTVRTVLESGVDRIPWIVDLDAHVVEPVGAKNLIRADELRLSPERT